MKNLHLLVWAVITVVTLMPNLSMSQVVDENERMLNYIATREPPADVTLEGWHAQKDRMLRVLTHRSPPVAGLAERLIALAKNTEQESVTRAYILQHLELNVYDHASAGTRGEIRVVLRESVASPSRSDAGTALLAMHRLANRDPALPKREVEDAAFGLLEANDISQAAKVSALNVAADLAPERARAESERLLNAESAPFVRAAAKVLALPAEQRPTANGCIGCEK